MFLTMHDITDRKRAEEALRDSEARFRLTFDQSPVGKIIIDLSFRTLRVNDALCRFLGYSAEEMKAKTFVDFTHPDDLPRELQAGRAMQGKHGTALALDKRYIRKDGQVVWGHLVVDAVRDPQGQPLYYVGLVQDITDRKPAEESLRQTVAELERSNKELEQFAYISAHDLQEPLRQVRAYVGMLKDRHADKFDGKAAQYFDFVHEGAARMSDLVRGLLEYSRVGSRGGRPPADGLSAQALDCRAGQPPGRHRRVRAPSSHATTCRP